MFSFKDYNEYTFSMRESKISWETAECRSICVLEWLQKYTISYRRRFEPTTVQEHDSLVFVFYYKTRTSLLPTMNSLTFVRRMTSLSLLRSPDRHCLATIRAASHDLQLEPFFDFSSERIFTTENVSFRGKKVWWRGLHISWVLRFLRTTSCW